MNIKTDKEVRNVAIALILVIVIACSYMFYSIYVLKKIMNENVSLKQQLQVIKETEQKPEDIEGQYTLITNLSSSIYLNRIPNNFEKIYPWEDINGVKGFDTVSGGLYLRYVEGHIEWPQLSLYAPEMHMEVVSDTKWPKEGP